MLNVRECVALVYSLQKDTIYDQITARQRQMDIHGIGKLVGVPICIDFTVDFFELKDDECMRLFLREPGELLKQEISSLLASEFNLLREQFVVEITYKNIPLVNVYSF